jgi:hypothetical protein
MLNWFKNLSTKKKIALGVVVFIIVAVIVYFLLNRKKRNDALAAAKAKAKKGQDLKKWTGRPVVQAEWDRFNGGLRAALGNDAVTDADNSAAFGLLKGLNLSWENLHFFKNEIADYVAANGDGDEFVTVGMYL